MPSINFLFLNQLKSEYMNYPTFIETGTHMGDSIFAMEPYFKSLHTIELDYNYYNYTKNRYGGNKIQFILGDSSTVFNTLLPSIETDSIFFLDGHWSGGNTAKGNKDCPLIEEIISINSNFKHNGIIIIDDYRLFGKGPQTGCNEDWANITITEILSILQHRIVDSYTLDSDATKNDRYIIHINSIS